MSTLLGPPLILYVRSKHHHLREPDLASWTTIHANVHPFFLIQYTTLSCTMADHDPQSDPDSDSPAPTLYTPANLPPIMASYNTEGWGSRMIFRLTLRAPFLPVHIAPGTRYELHLGLCNEMSLFLRNVMEGKGVGVKIEAWPKDSEAEVKLEDVDGYVCGYEGLRWPGFNGGGRGGCVFSAQRTSKSQGEEEDDKDFYIKVSAVRSPQMEAHGVQDAELMIVPLVAGPFRLTPKPVPEDSYEIVHTQRILQFPDGTEGGALVRESPESGIVGKIWDSSFFTAAAAWREFTNWLNHASTEGPKRKFRVLDLSCGTGAVGVWMAAAAAKAGLAHFLEVVLTDLEEGLATIEENVELNRSGNGVKMSVQELFWGKKEDVERVGDVSLVLACDLVYEAEFFAPLLETLDWLCIPNKTVILLGYKQRGLTIEERTSMWNQFQERFTMRREEHVMTAGIGGFGDIDSEDVGCEIYRITSPNRIEEIGSGMVNVNDHEDVRASNGDEVMET
ncbi:hypothetical protein SAICODRAFT_64182 [Saitoella complicata NRRL Y-17804]|uniref:uncharacterized protein n=1 Tax=Saitoella complicata (strain BCRC 22490 / CBS 7301 / JCM 7358 / NBRC 10748 / NRRL Y-17804) TaxID=698492 RepID=UPI00086793A8|nr:uncharacterized protein SAICODRAFT_64182 [Saitoella complicata NRRL Y-17804]ODQ54901.1 hypothetical protein SAICODRAFT_64182 [Saitoella complicata NRRL Y-17804]